MLMVLDSCPDAERVNMSKIQARAVMELINAEGRSLSAEAAADLAPFILEVPFVDPYKQLILATLEKQMSVLKQCVRRDMQDYTSAANFFAQTHWSKMIQHGNVNSMLVRDTIIRHVVNLGCTNPSEPTSRLFASLWMLLTDGFEKAIVELTVEDKRKKRDSFKHAMKAYVRGLPNDTKNALALMYLPKLHDSPVCLKAVRPDVYETVFQSIGEPVPVQVDMDELLQVDMSYPCRGSGPGTSTAMMLRSAINPMTGQNPMPMTGQNSMNLVVGSLVEGLKNLGSQQQQMIEAMLGQRNEGVKLQINTPNWSRRLGAPPDPEVHTSVESRLQMLEDRERGPLVETTVGRPVGLLQDPVVPLQTAPSEVTGEVTESTNEGKTINLLGMILDRKNEAAQLKKSQRRVKVKSDVKSEEDDKSSEEDDEVQPQPKKRANSAPAPTPPKKIVKLAESASKKTKSSPMKPKSSPMKPTTKILRCGYTTEWSRNQVMCRTGLHGPGQSHRIKWGSGEECLNVKAAHKAADKWVKDICSTFGSVDAIVVDLYILTMPPPTKQITVGHFFAPPPPRPRHTRTPIQDQKKELA